MADTMTLSQAVAEEIRVLLTRRRMSGRQLAAKLDVSQTWMADRLNGKTPIDLNDLDRIAGALNVEVFDLLPQQPRSGEGRTVVVAGEPRRSTTVANHTPAKRPQLTGHPKPFAPHDSTRRPVRLSPVSA
jgi:DNA-binding Xre family transcriptional regulator